MDISLSYTGVWLGETYEPTIKEKNGKMEFRSLDQGQLFLVSEFVLEMLKLDNETKEMALDGCSQRIQAT